MERIDTPNHQDPTLNEDRFCTVEEIQLPTLFPERFTSIIGKRRAERVSQAAARARAVLANRTVWNINSTGAGGGVAEMLQTFLGYLRGTGINARWLVIQGDAEFFAITKRIHNGLHGSQGDGGPLGAEEHRHYSTVMNRNVKALASRIRPRDIVILHDPQTAGLAPLLKALGTITVWRCHIGHDTTDPIVERTWEFLRPYLKEAHAHVFTREAYAPPWLNGAQVRFIPPSIDVFSTKNRHIDTPTVRAILGQIGLLGGKPGNGTAPMFRRNDGSAGRVERKASIVHSGMLPTILDPLAVQISRWDRLKDMLGVMRGFAASGAESSEAYLALIGPDVRGVTDDPEGTAVFAECMEAWQELPQEARDRVLLVRLPMEDIEENAAMVNAIQRHASVIIQKSLLEGFGLTVTEAMWKGRPLLVSGVGGIQDQIKDGKHGLVLPDPTDLAAFGATLDRLLGDRALARRLGRNAKSRCIAHFLGPRHLTQYADLLADVG